MNASTEHAFPTSRPCRSPLTLHPSPTQQKDSPVPFSRKKAYFVHCVCGQRAKAEFKVYRSVAQGGLAGSPDFDRPPPPPLRLLTLPCFAAFAFTSCRVFCLALLAEDRVASGAMISSRKAQEVRETETDRYTRKDVRCLYTALHVTDGTLLYIRTWWDTRRGRQPEGCVGCASCPPPRQHPCSSLWCLLAPLLPPACSTTASRRKST